MALFLDVGPDDALLIGEDLVVTVERKSGSKARLRIDGKTPVKLVRDGKNIAEAAGKYTTLRHNTGD